MSLENCPKCSKELTTLQSSGRQICRSCGWMTKKIKRNSKKLIKENKPYLSSLQEDSWSNSDSQKNSYDNGDSQTLSEHQPSINSQNQVTESKEKFLFHEGEVLELAVNAKKLYERTQCPLFSCIKILRETNNILEDAIDVMYVQGLLSLPEDLELNQKNKQKDNKSGALSSEVFCPKCHCSRFIANKKGFRAGKAFAGTVLFGGLGVLGGFIGSDEVQVTCLKCGYSWTPGK